MSHKFQIYFSKLLAKIVLYILEFYSVDTCLLLSIVFAFVGLLIGERVCESELVN